MKWVNTPNVGRSGFVNSRLLYQDVAIVAEVSRHGDTYWLDFTRFAPEDAQRGHQREFMSLESAKAYAMTLVQLTK